MSKELQGAREEYYKMSLDKGDVMEDPMQQFSLWFGQYGKLAVRDFNTMTLCTVGKEGQPSARIVLLKGIAKGGFDFYTNYKSRKARNIEENPNVSLSFYWPEQERQVRVEGLAEKMSEAESDAYFAARPRGSQIGAWASPQSEEIESRGVLDQREAELIKKFEGREVPRPPHWGGFRVFPQRVEFWQGRPGRLHDRISYKKEQGKWQISRLAP